MNFLKPTSNKYWEHNVHQSHLDLLPQILDPFQQYLVEFHLPNQF